MKPHGQGKKRTYAIIALVLLTLSAFAGIIISIFEGQNQQPTTKGLYVEVWNPIANRAATGFIAVETVYPGTNQIHEEIPLSANYSLGFSIGNYTVGSQWRFVAFTNQCLAYGSNGACSTFQQYDFGTLTIQPYNYDQRYFVMQLVLNSTGAVGH